MLKAASAASTVEVATIIQKATEATMSGMITRDIPPDHELLVSEM